MRQQRRYRHRHGAVEITEQVTSQPAPATLPSPHSGMPFKLVSSFEELVSTRFTNGINALCWTRTLSGDFDEVVAQLNPTGAITPLDEKSLSTLSLSESGASARDTLISDLRLLRKHRLAPSLDCIREYPRDDDEVVATDVYSFHADSSQVTADTYLCTYCGAPSEGVRNDEVVRKIDLTAYRAALLARFGGEDNDEFRAYLGEHCYDLHYALLPHAQPFSFGVGNLWRIAIQHPESTVPPCIHRAPETTPGKSLRLLLIS